MSWLRDVEDLAARIDDGWADAGRDPLEFPRVSADALASRRPAVSIDPGNIVDWGLFTAQLPEQDDPRAIFAQPPLTLVHKGDFFVAAYFWMDATTAIHQHDFAGAFQVLSGASLHCDYEFAPAHEARTDVTFGAVRMRSAEVLFEGDVRPIRAGEAYIHSLYHLERPSVTLIVRTSRRPAEGPQYAYLRPCVRYDPERIDDTLLRRVQLLTLLRELRDPKLSTAAAELLRTQNPYGVLVVLNHLYNLFGYSAAVRRLADLAQPRLPDGADVHGVLRYRRRQDVLLSARSAAADSDQRLLVGLLLHELAAEHFRVLARARLGSDWSPALERAADAVLHRAGSDDAELTALVRDPLAAAAAAAPTEAR